MTPLLVFAALAADPVRCTATWAGPVPGCQVRQPLRVEATARGESAARAALREQLALVLLLWGDAQRARTPALSDAEFQTCGDAAEEAPATCFPEPQLAGPRLCFVDLPVPECWTGDTFSIEVSGVRALEQGRAQMCARVDARLVELAWTDVESRRRTCAARCEAETRVRCTEG